MAIRDGTAQVQAPHTAYAPDLRVADPPNTLLRCVVIAIIILTIGHFLFKPTDWTVQDQSAQSTFVIPLRHAG